MDPALVRSIFRTRISRTRQAVPAPPGAAVEWLPGLPLSISLDEGHDPPVLTIQLGRLTVFGGPDHAGYVMLSRQLNEEVIVAIDLGEEAGALACSEDPEMYLAASATLDPSGLSFTGSVTSTCKDLSGNGAYLWTGENVELDGADGRRPLSLAHFLHQPHGLHKKRERS